MCKPLHVKIFWMRFAWNMTAALLGVALSSTSLPADGMQATSRPSDQLLAEFEVDHWAEPISIPVTWNGKAAVFLLDTGMGLTALNSRDFPDLDPFGLDTQIDSAAGKRTTHLFFAPELKVGPFSLGGSEPVTRVDLSEWEMIIGHPVIGILGVATLKESVIQLDFDARKLRFLRPDDKAHREWGTPLPMELNAAHCPSVKVRVGGVERGLTIDTGSDGAITLPSRDFEVTHDLAKQPVISSPYLTADGTVQIRKMRVSEFDLAEFRYHDLICNETKASMGALGLDFLERHLVTLDFVGHRLYLKPGKEFEHRTESNMSGIHAARLTDNRLVTQLVDINSPAFQAGIRAGDALIELNGRAASEYDTIAFHDLICAGDGAEITVKFRRDLKEQTVKIKLRRAI